MSQKARRDDESRKNSRRKLPAMYTLIRVKPRGNDRYCWTSHIYDISASGMRFELDQPLEPGTQIEIRAMLPGADHTTIRASGQVVRLHDDEDDLGPTRMGMCFEKFRHHTDRTRLSDYLGSAILRAA